jgi:hypothetical protein
MFLDESYVYISHFLARATCPPVSPLDLIALTDEEYNCRRSSSWNVPQLFVTSSFLGRNTLDHCSFYAVTGQVSHLSLTEHHTMKTYWEWRYSFTRSLTSALNGGEWSASRPGRFTPRERAPGAHSIER